MKVLHLKARVNNSSCDSLTARRLLYLSICLPVVLSEHGARPGYSDDVQGCLPRLCVVRSG